METELDAVLIDAFDVEPATEDVTASVRRQKQEAVPVREYRPPVARRSDSSVPVGALRHYPSLDALGPPGPATAPPPQPPVASANATSNHGVPLLSSAVHYPRWQSTNVDATLWSPSAKSPSVDREKHNDDGCAPPPPPHRQVTDADNSHEDVVETEMLRRKPPPGRAEVPMDEEVAHQRQLLEAEIRRFQQTADYMALALAGETPHQIEARRHREEERREREERRLAALETRVLNAIEREQQREERALERRKRHAERTHRSSVSPSPERDDLLEDEGPSPQPPARNADGVNEA